MKVEIVVDPSRPQSLSQRVGPAPVGATAVATKKKGPRAAKKKGPKRTKKSAEDLDAEMADYTAGTSAAVAAPAA